MAGYPPDALVMVTPFAHRREGDTVTIGDIQRQVFLDIPAEGLDILQSLQAGNTVAETARLIEERYGESPDLEEFLEIMRAEGFLAAPDGTFAVPEQANVEVGEDIPPPKQGRTWSMNWLSPAAAQKLLGWPFMTGAALIILAGIVATGSGPGLFPTPKALLFTDNFAILTWATFFTAMGGVALHEFAHVIAARAAGIPARIGLGNQLYVLVAQTDMTGIWLVPKRRRYLAFMIGSIVDGVSWSVLAMLLWADAHGKIDLGGNTVMLFKALTLTYFTRIVWQWFFFLRTDGYYVIATALNCKSLLTDTEDYFYNKFAFLRRSRLKVDQSHIPARERRIVKIFAPIWVVGRAFSIVYFCMLGVPIFWGYLEQFYLLVTNGNPRFESWDFITVFVLGVTITGGGIYMWFKAMITRALDRRAATKAALAAHRDTVSAAYERPIGT